MTKHYFVSYLIDNGGSTIYGCRVMSATNKSLREIAKETAEHNGCDGLAIITCLKDLSEEEFNMLNGK